MRLGLIAAGVALVSVLSVGALAQPATAPAPAAINVGDRLLVIMTDGAEVKTLVAGHHVVVDDLGNIDVPGFGLCAAKGATPDLIEQTMVTVLKQDKKMRLPRVSVVRQSPVAGAKPIRPGDTLAITMTQTQGRFLAGRETLTVDDQGAVTFPAIGPYRMGGLTPAEAEVFLARALELQMIMKKPRVTVKLNTPTTQPTP